MKSMYYLQITGKIKGVFKEGVKLGKMTEFEILIKNQDNLLVRIYKLLLKHGTETEKLNCMINGWKLSKKQ